MDAFEGADPAVAVAEELFGQGEPVEDDAFVAGAFVVFGAGAFFLFGAAVDDVGLFGAEADGAADGVHGGVAGADDGGVAGALDGGVVVGEGVGVHEVDAGEEFVGGVDAFEVFAGDVHEDG